MIQYGPRFESYIGFVSPPAAFSNTAQLFLELCASKAGVIQYLPHYPDAHYGADIDDGKRRLEMLKDGIAGLSEAGAQIVAQDGGFWSLSYAPDLATARALEKELSDEFGVHVILNWTAIVDALLSVNARRISVTTGYYRPAWTAASIAFLESAGFQILWSGDLLDQGVLADEQARDEVEAATHWDYPNELVHRTCVEANRLAPDCDAVCQLGMGMRVIYVAEAVEAEIRKPLVSTDLGLYWAVLNAGKLSAKSGYGSLLASA